MNIRNQSVLGFVLLLLTMLCSCTDDESETQGVWERRSDFDGVARAQACGFTIGEKGYLCCGYTMKKHLKDMWVYDTEHDYWMQCASMPDEAPARKDAVAFAVNGKGYVTTGGTTEAPYYYKDTWEYDPDTDSWTQKDDFMGTARIDALAFSIKGYGYVGTGYDDNYLKDIYRFDPSAPAGSQWQIVNGYGGTKRRRGSAFVIDNAAYICLGSNNSSYVYDFWKFDGTTWKQLRDISNTDDDNDYDDDYNIVRESAVTFVIDGKGYVALGTSGSLRTDYWVYYPEQDLWYGDTDDDYTPFEGSSRQNAVSFSTGTRGFIATGKSGSYVFDDVWELLPYEMQD